jgi:hypothetical protein
VNKCGETMCDEHECELCGNTDVSCDDEPCDQCSIIGNGTTCQYQVGSSSEKSPR